MKFYLPIILIILLFGGCDMFKHKEKITNIPELNTKKDISQAQIIIEQSIKDIEIATVDIDKETQNIKQQTSQASNTIPVDIKTQIDVHLEKINNSSTVIGANVQNINKATAELSGANSLLENAGGKLSNIETALNKMTKERDEAILAKDKAILDRDSQLHKTMKWLIAGCIILTGVFAVLFVLYGNKFGLTGAAICGVVCALAIFIETYFIYVAIFGGLILLALIGALIYTVIVKNKAFSQVVDTVEVAKSALSIDKKAKLFGEDGQTGIMDKIQSPSTMDLVKKEKAKMSLWNSMKKQ